jgi:hypothetical protein
LPLPTIRSLELSGCVISTAYGDAGQFEGFKPDCAQSFETKNGASKKISLKLVLIIIGLVQLVS